MQRKQASLKTDKWQQLTSNQDIRRLSQYIQESVETHNASHQTGPRSQNRHHISRRCGCTCGPRSCIGTRTCGRSLQSSHIQFHHSCHHSHCHRHTPTTPGCTGSWNSWTQTLCSLFLHNKKYYWELINWTNTMIITTQYIIPKQVFLNTNEN